MWKKLQKGSVRDTALSAALALVSAVAWSLCFEQEPAVLLPWVALAPMLFLLGRRRPFLWGWLFGFVFWATSMSWLTPTLMEHGGLNPLLARFLNLLCALYLGLDQALFAWVGSRLWRRGGSAALLGLPSLWVVMEVLRGFPFGGFPWNLAAYAWVETPGALLLSAWVGAFGVSWWLLFANTSLALALRERRWDIAVSGLLLAALILTLAARFSHGEEPLRERSVLHRGGNVGEVRIVQPNSPIVSVEEAWPNYQRLVRMSLDSCDGTPGRLVIWPESAAFPLYYAGSERLRDDLARIHAAGCEVLLGTVTFEGENYYNSALLTSAEGVKGSYSKRRLVPWGEYIPLKDILPFVGKLARNAGEFTPGDNLGLLPWNGEKIGMAICYEVVFPGAMAEQVRAGATLLGTITNDAWYGDTAAPWQHFRAVRFRAAENRRPMVRAALTGVSALVDARGVVVEDLGVLEEGVISGRVRGQRGLTPFNRAPSLVIVLSLFLVGFAIVRARAPRMD